MSDEPAQLSRLIAEIYDAALDRTLWPSALQRTCEYVDGRTSGLMSHDIHQQNANFYYTWNDNPEFTKLYAEKYARLNPAVVHSMLQTQVGEVSTIPYFVPVDEYRASQIYGEFSKPQGYLDSIQTGGPGQAGRQLHAAAGLIDSRERTLVDFPLGRTDSVAFRENSSWRTTQNCQT